MDKLIFSFRIFIYFFIAIFNLPKILNSNKILFLDLDYTLCDNKKLRRAVTDESKLVYKLDIPINLEIKDLVNDYSDFKKIILTARGLRSMNPTKEWLKRNDYGEFQIMFIGETWLKLIPILFGNILRKKLILVDDLTTDGIINHPLKALINKKKFDKLTYIDSLKFK
jgi:hypothetical protein